MMGSGLSDDAELMKTLRRVNLDAFWNWEPTTVSQNLGKVNRSLQISHGMGMSNHPMPKLVPWKLEDDFGAGAAVIMTRHSMDPGVMEDTMQFETVRKMKSVFVKLYQAYVGNVSTAVIRGKDDKTQLVTKYPFVTDRTTGRRWAFVISWGIKWCNTMASQ
jgi:hypothetical protein